MPTTSDVIKTNEYIQSGGKKHVIYKGPRGGKYIKKDGKFVSLAK